MIIDAHCHLTDEDWLSEKWWDGLAGIFVSELKAKGQSDINLEIIKKKIPRGIFDPSGKKLIKAMRIAGIDKSIIFSVDWGLEIGEPKVPILEQNRFISEAEKQYPDKLVSFATVDPRRPDAEVILRTCFEEYKMKGLKLHPCGGYYPNTKETYKLLDICKEFDNKPVISHTGQIVQPLRSKYADPIYLDDVCIDYPELTIQAAHMSFGWRHSLFHQGHCKPNLLTDISGWQIIALKDYNEFAIALRECINGFSAERVLFGTDNPYLRSAFPDKNWIQMIKDLPEKAPNGIEFTQEEVDLILGGNAQRIYGL